MEMTAEAIKLIQETATAAQSAKITMPDVPAGQEFYLTNPNGTVDAITAEAPPRRHVFDSLDDLMAYASERCEDPVVWYGRTRVMVIADDKGSRHDAAQLPLRWTDQFEFVHEHAKAPRNQAAFAKMLRIELAGTLSGHIDLLSWIKNVRFSASRAAQGSVELGKESMGRQIAAEVDKLDTLPDVVTLHLRVFAGRDMMVMDQVPCALDVLVSEELFRLVPLPNALNDALDSACALIGDRLREGLKAKGCPVYFGDPVYPE